MFCCSPRPVTLSMIKLQPDFELKQLYIQKIVDKIKKQGSLNTLSRQNHIEIDNKNNHSFKVGPNSSSKFSLELCDASRQISISQTQGKVNESILWRVLNQAQAHCLIKGDKIKIGMTEFGVYSKKSAQLPTLQKLQFISEQHCRSCFSNTYNSQDPLVSICKCSGTVKYLHLSCIRDWINMKLQIQNRENVVFYIYRNLSCELCKTEWPLHFTANNIQYDLLQFDSEDDDLFELQPQTIFIVLQTDSLDQDQSQIKVFAKIKVKQHFFFGDEDSNADLQLDTYGISSLHCYLYKQNDDIYIIDCGSITGTLVSLHDQELFTSKKAVVLQYDQILIQIGVETNFFDCFNPEYQFKLRYKKIKN